MNSALSALTARRPSLGLKGSRLIRLDRDNTSAMLNRGPLLSILRPPRSQSAKTQHTIIVPLVVCCEREMVHEDSELRRASLDLGEVFERACPATSAVAGRGMKKHHLAQPAVKDRGGDACPPPIPRRHNGSHEVSNSCACFLFS